MPSRPLSLAVNTFRCPAVTVPPVGLMMRTSPSRSMKNTRPSLATSSIIGLDVLLSSATFSKLPLCEAEQSAFTAPAAVRMPPRSMRRKFASTKLSLVWPSPVYQERPPS